MAAAEPGVTLWLCRSKIESVKLGSSITFSGRREIVRFRVGGKSDSVSSLLGSGYCVRPSGTGPFLQASPCTPPHLYTLLIACLSNFNTSLWSAEGATRRPYGCSCTRRLSTSAFNPPP